MARPFRIATGLALLTGWCLLSPVAVSQSLEEQYAAFLNSKCAAMEFERIGRGELAPGQAGEPLQGFCSGLVPDLDTAPGTVSFSASGGFAAGGTGGEAARHRRADTSEEHAVATLQGRNGIHASLTLVDESQDPTSFEGGYQAGMLGLTLGVDRRLGAGVLAGVAVVLEERTGDFDSGGNFRHRGVGLLLHASWPPSSAAYVDFDGGATLRKVRSSRMVSFTRTFTPVSGQPPRVAEIIPAAPVHSTTDQVEWLASLQAGFDLRRGGISFGPRLDLNFRQVGLDATVESGTTAMALVIDGQAGNSLRTGAGAGASRVINTASAVLVVQLDARWWHEFGDDQRFITARFAQDLRPEPSRLRYQNAPPDRDVYTMRASLAVTMRRGWGAFAAVELLAGHSYQDRNGVSLGLRREL